MMNDMNIVKVRTYPISRYASVEVAGREFRVVNEVTGIISDRVYRTYAAARGAAFELGNQYYNTERLAGWR